MRPGCSGVRLRPNGKYLVNAQQDQDPGHIRLGMDQFQGAALGFQRQVRVRERPDGTGVGEPQPGQIDGEQPSTARNLLIERIPQLPKGR